MRACCRWIKRRLPRFAVAVSRVVCAVLVLGVIEVAPLSAAETYVIRSETQYLHLWSGPGTEYQVLLSLPNGSKVIAYEYWGQWAKVSPIAHNDTIGWVLKRDLVVERQTAVSRGTALDREQEERRFARLRRKGVLGVQREGGDGVLRLTMNHLLWYRLPAIQQENFLRRARQFFGGSVVEIRDPGNASLMARLTAMGMLEVPLAPAALPAPLDDAALRTPSRPTSSAPGQ